MPKGTRVLLFAVIHFTRLCGSGDGGSGCDECVCVWLMGERKTEGKREIARARESKRERKKGAEPESQNEKGKETHVSGLRI